MVNGYIGQLLRVDLSTNTLKTEALDLDLAKKYLGGSGLSGRIIYDEAPPEVSPFDPDNRLVFMTGPITGTIAPAFGRYVVCTRSPLTGIWAEAHSAGFWGPELKFANFDGIVIQGKAEFPVYLWIKDGEAEIKSAERIWGRDTFETETLIKKELGEERLRVACIGPAGERLVKIANVMNDLAEGTARTAGRCGTGAVMGSKNLKAIAVLGTRYSVLPAARDELLKEYVKKIHITIRSHPTVQIYASFGTDGIMNMMHEYGDVPIKYWTEGYWPEGVDKISGEAMARRILVKQNACYRCPIACRRYVKVSEGQYQTVEGEGPEYESAASLGALCLNDNLESIAKANELCNRYGIDTISTGSVMAFAMECRQRGLITDHDTDGVDLRWGNHQAMIEMLHKIARREGFGATLAEGVKRAAEIIGHRADEFAMHVKGLEIPMHDPRAFKGMGLQYATSHRGACHLRGLVYEIEQGGRIPDLGIHERVERFPVEGKARIVITMQNWHEVLDSLIMCKFAFLPPGSVAAIFSMVTGWTVRHQELIEAGERSWNVKRAFNIKCGVTAKDDTLPRRLLSEPLRNGGSKGQIVELDKMLPQYYRLRGWTPNGVPTKEKLDSLGLHDIANDLAKYVAN